MSKSESLSFSTGGEEDSVVDLTSNKYAGIELNMLVFLFIQHCPIQVLWAKQLGGVTWDLASPSKGMIFKYLV